MPLTEKYCYIPIGVYENTQNIRVIFFCLALNNKSSFWPIRKHKASSFINLMLVEEGIPTIRRLLFTMFIDPLFSFSFIRKLHANSHFYWKPINWATFWWAHSLIMKEYPQMFPTMNGMSLSLCRKIMLRSLEQIDSGHFIVNKTLDPLLFTIFTLGLCRTHMLCCF